MDLEELASNTAKNSGAFNVDLYFLLVLALYFLVYRRINDNTIIGNIYLNISSYTGNIGKKKMTLIERLSKEIAEKTTNLEFGQGQERGYCLWRPEFPACHADYSIAHIVRIVPVLTAEVLLIGFTSAAVRKYAGECGLILPPCALISSILFGGMTLLVKFLPILQPCTCFQILIARHSIYSKLEPMEPL